jgi:hypothetical protein
MREKYRVREGVKTGPFRLRGKSQAKKNVFFCHGEVFFLLTYPLMGDPFTTQFRSRISSPRILDFAFCQCF